MRIECCFLPLASSKPAEERLLRKVIETLAHETRELETAQVWLQERGVLVGLLPVMLQNELLSEGDRLLVDVTDQLAARAEAGELTPNPSVSLHRLLLLENETRTSARRAAAVLKPKQDPGALSSLDPGTSWGCSSLSLAARCLRCAFHAAPTTCEASGARGARGRAIRLPARRRVQAGLGPWFGNGERARGAQH